ncbi:MAG: hypothetical protein CVU97_07510 [Firmicutes bacterium HGW-Firmicutes-21]|nr:MAG: hypothetical protein CVU97_07510 [Firmicutes bacterium HGW-Firmicutes-21]
MIKKFFLLVKVSFFLNLNPNKMMTRQNAPVSRKKSLLYGFLMLVMFCYFLAMSSGMYHFLGSTLAEIGYIDLMIYFAVISYTALILLLTIFSAQGYLYKSKDLPLLLSLPVSHFTVLSSKFLLLYIYELFFSVLVLGPAFFFYFYFTAFSAVGIIGAFICFIVSPLIPLSIGSLLSYFIGLITRRMRKKNFFTVVLTFALLAVWFIAVQNGQRIINYILTNTESLQTAFSRFYLPTVWVAGSLNGNLLYTILFFLLSVFITLGVFYTISKKYSDIISILNSSGIKKRYKPQSIRSKKQSSVLVAMIKKELDCYFGSVNYLLNTIIGPVLLIIGSTAMLFVGAEQILELSFTEGFGQIGLVIAAVMTVFIPCLSPTTSAVISIEGKKLWIYKSLPAQVKDILIAKTAVNLIISVPSVIIGAALLCIALGLSIFDYFILITLGITFITFCSLTGILINLAHPKLDFDNEIVVVKQSMSVILQMLVGFGTIIGLAIAYIILSPVDFYFYAMSILVIMWGVIALLIKMLFSWGVKRFNEL